jgi:hypothetical protein
VVAPPAVPYRRDAPGGWRALYPGRRAPAIGFRDRRGTVWRHE